jgi:hypothetical protein
MSEQETDEKSSSETKYPTPLKRFILTVIGLFVFVILFGEIVPRLMFEKENRNTADIKQDVAKPEETLESKETTANVINQETSTITTPSFEDAETTATSELIASNPATSPAPQAPSTEPTIIQSSEKDKEHLRELEEKITSLQIIHETAISEMQKKLEAQNIESQHKYDSLISALIVFGQLKETVSSGKPYAGELEQLKKFTAGNSEIEKAISLIEPDANTGITISSKLKSNFTPLIKQALTNKDESALRKIFHKFITVRKVGEQSGSTDEAILARAEMKLVQNDLSTTLGELEQLSPEAKEIFKDWQEDAHKLLKIQKNLSRLQLLLTQTNTVQEP